MRCEIRGIFQKNASCYGYRRIYTCLKKKGITLSEKVVRRIMRQEKLEVYVSSHRKYSSYKGEISPEVPNILQRNFCATSPNQKWLTDLTEFALPAGKVYLSPVIDCFDGMVHSWTIGTSPNAQLVNNMLEKALATLRPGEHPIIHSDRGCHYRWPEWIKLVHDAGLTRSMSRKGCSPDNSACEGFFGRLKNEMYYGRSWAGVSLERFMEILDNYIHWYNGPLRKFCVSVFRQNQEYHIINVHDWGLFPLATAFPGSWDGMRALRGVNAVPASRES